MSGIEISKRIGVFNFPEIACNDAPIFRSGIGGELLNETSIIARYLVTF